MNIKLIITVILIKPNIMQSVFMDFFLLQLLRDLNKEKEAAQNK